MSNSLAIAAVTATLRSLLTHGLGIADVTVQPLDSAGKGVTGDRLNLFLYQTLPDAAWRNLDMPRQAHPGEPGRPPLPLTLYYLVTAFSAGDDDSRSHVLLGQAMALLHDHPLLDPSEIESATAADLPTSDLQLQIERVRVTLQPLPFDEMSKLWTAFQTQFRLSAAYQVSVVLIESTQPVARPLPVLARGKDDRGVGLVSGALPALAELRPPLNLPAVQLGDPLTLVGRELRRDGAQVLLQTPRVAAPFAPALLAASAAQLVVQIPPAGNPADPNAPTATWPAGFYGVRAVATRAGQPDLASNELPIALAPAITVAPNAAPAGDLTLTVTCDPMVWPGQRVSLLFGDREVPAPAPTVKTRVFTFAVTAVPAGQYVVRLRVDGIDSLPIDRTAPTPRFDGNQQVKVT
jgi:hypothetical protein